MLKDLKDILAGGWKNIQIIGLSFVGFHVLKFCWMAMSNEIFFLFSRPFFDLFFSSSGF